MDNLVEDKENAPIPHPHKFGRPLGAVIIARALMSILGIGLMSFCSNSEELLRQELEYKDGLSFLP